MGPMKPPRPVHPPWSQPITGITRSQCALTVKDRGNMRNKGKAPACCKALMRVLQHHLCKTLRDLGVSSRSSNSRPGLSESSRKLQRNQRSVMIMCKVTCCCTARPRPIHIKPAYTAKSVLPQANSTVDFQATMIRKVSLK